MFEIKYIGHVKSCYPDKFGTPRQPGLAPHARAFLKLSPEVQPEFSLQGLNEFSHLWVIFQFHKNNTARFHAKVHPPRLGGETVGVFATRSPHRPNPIGLSLVEIVSVENDGVWVRGVDLIEGTPIIDLKPYLPQIESKPNALGGWSNKQPLTPIEILWPSDGQLTLQKWSSDKNISPDEITALIEDTLKLDPRPVVYRGFEGEESPYRDAHAVRIYDLDIHFHFVTPTQIQIDKIVT